MAETFIAFLRAVNVGGRTVTMERLRGLVGELGLADVRTYIQSGNVFFSADAAIDRPALTRRIEEHLEQALGFPVPVMLRTVAEVEELIASDPFRGIELTAENRFCVVFLSEPLPPELELPHSTPKGDLEVIGATEDAAFVVAHIINGRPAGNPGAAFGRSYRGLGTARFLHTTVKIVAAAKKKA
ncbi:uncharacterized protein (DUF1697 family) [Kitasatospora sp. MAA4]|uniref:DUF1697 domain-containing protein n=1 Tax=Kitasatospora sp. MAA4 TaxID=3035093 RepID=UPI002475B1A6|nr:DUF1697 domain-containing protein [Kitasatospora sp. MAA4]MDH6134868.1 uncharacterized protein (DUF1697 family) [Kitasatospora sp. MAA4]